MVSPAERGVGRGTMMPLEGTGEDGKGCRFEAVIGPGTDPGHKRVAGETGPERGKATQHGGEAHRTLYGMGKGQRGRKTRQNVVRRPEV